MNAFRLFEAPDEALLPRVVCYFDDIGSDGMQLIAEICDIYGQFPEFETQVLVASIRHPIHVVQAAKLGELVDSPRGIERPESRLEHLHRQRAQALRRRPGVPPHVLKSPF